MEDDIDMLTFGKYDGYSVEYVFKNDRPYLEWLVQQDWFEDKCPDTHEHITNYLNANKR